MRISLVFAVVGASVAFCVTSSAQPQDASPTNAAAEVRRDPNGIKGISPYAEELAQGRTAIQKSDHAAAIAAFDAAVAKEPDRMEPYLLKAQAQLAKGDLDGAIATAATGRTKRGTGANVSKLTFLSAELDERKADSKPGEDNDPKGLDRLKVKWDAVKDAWQRYLTYVTENPGGIDYKESAEERQTKIDQRVERDTKYALVKKRIADNEANPEQAKQ